MAMPKKDGPLVSWGSNFDTKVTLAPVKYSLSAAQALQFHTAFQPFATSVAAVATAKEAGTRSKVLTATKDANRSAFLKVARELYALVQDAVAVSDADKADVGVHVRKTTPTPAPVPADAPGISVLATIGNTIKLRLFDPTDSARRGRAPGTDGAALFSHVGPTPPADESGWRFEGNTGRTRVEIVFPAGTPAGSTVWLTAFWFNGRKQRGPAASPVCTNLPAGAAMAA